jgi:hypothetical protein
MATKKKAPALAAPTDNTDELARAFAQRLKGSLAEREVKKGWSFSDEMDILWSAGWPYTVLVDDGPSAPTSDPLAAEALFKGALWDWTPRFSRAALWGYHRVMRDGQWAAQGQLTDESRAMFADGTPFTDDEARAFIQHRTHPVRALGSTGRLVPWAIASITSPALVAEAMLSAAEQWTDEELNGWGVGSCAMFHQLGFVLRWLPVEQHRRAIERLTALRDRAEKQWPHAPHELETVRELGWHFATFDLLVDGDRGARRRGYEFEGKPQAVGLDFVATHSLVADAAPGFVTGKRAIIHPRALWLGGESVLRWYCSNWKKFTADAEHARFVLVLGEVRSPLVTECMLAMTAESKAKKLARQWFDRRSDFSRQTLPALTSGPHGALASKILAELG